MQSQHEDKQLVALKRLVKTLGVILIIGSITVLSIALGRVTSKVKLKSSSNICKKIEEIQEDIAGKINEVRTNKSEIIIMSKDKDRQHITIIDRCTGQVSQRVTLKSF